jgi:CheY-like chemotaxis protein
MNQSDNTDATAQAAPARPLVLVVDDDAGLRDAMRDLLDDAGFASVGAQDGLDALRVLGDLPSAPTFILLDLMMPVMDGWAFCDSRGKIQALREIPVIAVSAAELSEADRPAGIDALLKKPVDVEKFALLAARLAGRRSRETRRVRLPH